MKKIILSLIILLNFSCSNNDNVENFQSQDILPALIGKGELSGDENIIQQNTVVTNQVQWNQLINDMNSINNISNTFTETNVDFNNYIIIVSIDLVRPNTGYSININSIVENENNITIDIQNVNHNGGFSSIIQPYHIVKIPIQNKPIIFE